MSLKLPGEQLFVEGVGPAQRDRCELTNIVSCVWEYSSPDDEEGHRADVAVAGGKRIRLDLPAPHYPFWARSLRVKEEALSYPYEAQGFLPRNPARLHAGAFDAAEQKRDIIAQDTRIHSRIRVLLGVLLPQVVMQACSMPNGTKTCNNAAPNSCTIRAPWKSVLSAASLISTLPISSVDWTLKGSNFSQPGIQKKRRTGASNFCCNS
jgi:hypothetical protein